MLRAALTSAVLASLVSLTGAGAVAATTATATATTGAGHTAATSSLTSFGTLDSNPSWSATERSDGITSAMLELSWRSYEPSPGVFNTSYINGMKAQLAALKASGRSVTLGLGMHYTPAWVLAMPNAGYVDEHGDTSTEANLIFNQQLRNAADGYLARVAADFGLNSFSNIRLTAGGDSEVLYPAGNDYWAFDVNAQNGPQMPASMARNPDPGWRPGTPGLTPAQVGTWLTWYVGALDNVVTWQQQELASLGFTGNYQVVTPGSGTRPGALPAQESSNLPDSVTGRGAVWQMFYADLPVKSHVVAYVSSVADGSGGNNLCTSSDDSVPLTSSIANSWSATRWISRIADAYGLGKAGENPGYSPTASYVGFYTNPTSTGMMATAIAQAVSCGFQNFYWAHDYTLTGNIVSLATYASDIALARVSEGLTSTAAASGGVATATHAPTAPTVTSRPTTAPSHHRTSRHHHHVGRHPDGHRHHTRTSHVVWV